MSTSRHDENGAIPASVTISGPDVIVRLADGRSISTPVDWYPKLLSASLAQRLHWELSPLGVHWPEVDEDLSIAGMLAGERPLTSESRSSTASQREDVVSLDSYRKQQRSFAFGNVAADREDIPKLSILDESTDAAG